jgi:hypothetical protein
LLRKTLSFAATLAAVVLLTGSRTPVQAQTTLVSNGNIYIYATFAQPDGTKVTITASGKKVGTVASGNIYVVSSNGHSYNGFISSVNMNATNNGATITSYGYMDSRLISGATTTVGQTVNATNAIGSTVGTSIWGLLAPYAAPYLPSPKSPLLMATGTGKGTWGTVYMWH